MKYLKLFEKVGYFEFENLINSLNLLEIDEEIIDLVGDLYDEIEPESRKIPKRRLRIKYTRERSFTTDLDVSNFSDKIRNKIELNADDARSLNDFLEKLNYASELAYESLFIPQFMLNQKKLQDLKESFKRLTHQLDLLGYKIQFSYTGAPITGVDFYSKSQSTLLEEVFDLYQRDLQNLQEMGDDEYQSQYIKFRIIADLKSDLSSVKAVIDTSPLPEHVLSDFEKFVKKYRITSQDQKRLVSWFQKDKESK